MQVYIQGTKKAINEQLAQGESLIFTEYKMFNINNYGFSRLPQGTVVKFWLKRDPSGTPIAKSYGQVKNSKII
jgi:hypothetical protein